VPSRKLEVIITGDTKSLERAYDRAGKKSKSFGASLGGMSKFAKLGAAGAAACCTGAAVGPESPFKMARTAPMTAFSPVWMRISVITPSSKASISIVALSVSISASTSPISTESPTFLCHLTRVPSVMVSESLGISMFTDMVIYGGGSGQRMGKRRVISSLFTVGCGNEKARGVFGSSALWKSIPEGSQGAMGFIVGIRPMCGLPTGPCALARLRVDSEVVPQQSFFGQ